MKTRVLLITEDLSTEDLSPLIGELREKFQDENLPVYHVGVGLFEEFVKEAGEFPFIFYEKSLNQNKLKGHINGHKIHLIRGVNLKDEGVQKFISSL